MLGLDWLAGSVPVNMYKMFFSNHSMMNFDQCLSNDHIVPVSWAALNLHIDELHTFWTNNCSSHQKMFMEISLYFALLYCFINRLPFASNSFFSRFNKRRLRLKTIKKIGWIKLPLERDYLIEIGENFFCRVWHKQLNILEELYAFVVAFFWH